MKRKLLGFSAIVILFSIAVVCGLQMVQVRIPATGDIRAIGLGVYSEQSCTTTLANIDWGLVSPGETKTFTCFLKSLSNVNTSLSLSVENWAPSLAVSYIFFSWNRESYQVAPGEVISAVLTLHVDSSIQGVSSFSFYAIVTATEA